jgi:adenylosuccinate synthase
MSRGEAIIVVDLGFGDAGKGTIVDALVRAKGAHTVVRFNGGAQAGHNVVTADGRHHTFAQLGSGTFVPGVRTHLSRFVVVHPTALLVEARRLAAVGVTDALGRVSISESALVTTPVHQAATRLRELARGALRHGSCGVGVGETVQDAIASPDAAPVARDLKDPTRLRRRVLQQQAAKRTTLDAEVRAVRRLPEALPEIRALEDPRIVDAWIDALEPLRAPPGILVPDDHLVKVLRDPGAVVFEGAQGVLLDEWRGFHPYTTWSTCTFDNALALLRDARELREVTRLGVLRTYATRHGPGPMPTEAPELAGHLPEPHNGTGPWQGEFRRGWLDLVLARYAATACGGVDAIALTHLDALPRLPSWRVCTRYRLAMTGATAATAKLFVPAPGRLDEVRALRLGALGDLDHSAALGKALAQIVPTYEDVARESLVERIEGELGAPVTIRSSGPTAADKELAPSSAGTRGGSRAGGSTACPSSTLTLRSRGAELRRPT